MTNASITTEGPCPTCGGGNGDLHDSAEAQRRIQELEGQIQELNQRAAVTGKLYNPNKPLVRSHCGKRVSRANIENRSFSLVKRPIAFG